MCWDSLLRQHLPKVMRLVVVVGLSLGVAVVLLEVGLRISGYKLRPHNWIFQNRYFFQDSEYFNFFQLDQRTIFSPKPNTLVESHLWQTDAQGFRFNPAHFGDQSAQRQAAYDLSLARCSRPLKILVLGDSFAYGHGVTHTQAWPAQLEQLLVQSGVSAVVANAAIPASTTDQQYARFQQLLPEMQPDMVIWMVNYNDMSENATACLYVPWRGAWVRLPAWFNVGYWSGWLQLHLPKWVATTSVGNFITTLNIFGKDFFTLGCSFIDQSPSDTPEITAYFAKLPSLLSQAQAEASAENTRLLFVLTPLQAYFDAEFANDHYQLSFFELYRQALYSAQVEWLDLTFQFAAVASSNTWWNRSGTKTITPIAKPWESNQQLRSPVTELFFDQAVEKKAYDGTYHPNALGNTLEAALVFSALQQQGWF